MGEDKILWILKCWWGEAMINGEKDKECNYYTFWDTIFVLTLSSPFYLFPRVSEEPVPGEDNLDLQDIYPRLKEIFHLLDTVGINTLEINSRPNWTDESPTCNLQKTPWNAFKRLPYLCSLAKCSKRQDRRDFGCYKTGHMGVILADC